MADLADDHDPLVALQQVADAQPEVPGHHAALGVALHAAGRHDEAVDAHRRALVALDEQRAVLHYNLAASLTALDRLDDAAAAYDAALAARPGWVIALDNLGGVRQRQGRIDDAERAYRAALAIDADHVVTRYNLGTLRMAAHDAVGAIEQFGRARAASAPSAAIEHALALAYCALDLLPQAIAAYQSALALAPDIPGAQHQLAMLLLRTDDDAGALVASTAACAAAPDDPDAHTLRGVALSSLERHVEAADAYAAACRLAPDRLDLQVNRARGAEALDDREGAVAAYRAVLDRAPDHVGALESLIRLLIDLDRRDEAIPLCERVLARAPDDAMTPHQLAALRGETPAAAPRDYIVEMFDTMAPRFEALLLGKLGYRVPEVLRATLDRVDATRRFARVLDLGCGTGLAGVQLRDRADVLDGVDLSAQMVAGAEAKGVYDELHVADVVEFLRTTPHRYDLVTAADVLVYFGDLAPVLAAARARLAPGGLLVCSVERTDDAEVQLATTGRYQHGRGYVERIAAAHDLAVVAFEPMAARLEAGIPVAAWMFVLRA